MSRPKIQYAEFISLDNPFRKKNKTRFKGNIFPLTKYHTTYQSTKNSIKAPTYHNRVDDLAEEIDIAEINQSFSPPVSPPPSQHSYQDENFVIDDEDIEKKRNQRVIEYLAIQPSSEPERIEHEWVIDEIPEVCYYDSTSANSSDKVTTQLKKPIGLDLAIQDLMKTEAEKREGLPSRVHFNAATLPWLFRPALMVMKLERVERILKGEAVDAIKTEDVLPQFLYKLYLYLGPLNKESEQYKAFVSDWCSEVVKANEELGKIKDQLIKSELSQSAPVTVKLAEMANMHLKHLRKAISEVHESTTDPATAFKTFGMDYYVLPRPQHSIGIYRIRTKEFLNLKEYQILLAEEKEVETLYNPALFDVGWHYFHKHVTLDVAPKKDLENWTKHALQLRTLLSRYASGVEAEVFLEAAQKELEIIELVGEFLDKEVLSKFSDIFFCQKMGNDNRLVLFPGIFEGVIVTPEELLRRVWKRIRVILQLKEPELVKINQLLQIYQKIFGHQLDISHWGFQSMKDLIDYSVENISDGIQDIELCSWKWNEWAGLRREWKCIVGEGSCAIGPEHFGPTWCEEEDQLSNWKCLFDNIVICESGCGIVSAQEFYKVLRG